MDSYLLALVIWKLDISDKIKRSFFPSSGRVHTTEWTHHIEPDNSFWENGWRPLHENASSYTKQILEETSNKTAAVRPPTTHLEDHPN